jgi:exopolysaccharide production protein ExoQ
MPPTLALVLWAVLLLALLRFDPAKEPGTSVALWIPLIWMFIMGSRLPSQWLGTGPRIAAQALEEGNPLDRSIFAALILLALLILTLRSFSWSGFISRNIFLMTFLLFAFASVFWSDFPFVSLKRWFRDLGNYLIILVVLSDPHPVEAVRTLFRRLAYLLIPLCILLDKYFPNLSKQYDGWSGASMYVGATTGKNLLGLLALLSGLFFIWDTVTRWSARKDRGTKRIIQVNLAFIVMSLWLLITANSATCRVCMLIGTVVVLSVHSAWGKRHLTLLRVLIPATFCLYLILAFGLGASGQMAAAVGKDPTLTDRTKIWSFVLSMHTNPLVGTGYESFWLGPRLEYFWQISGLGGLNEAHNGYLEIYLNLGLIGLLLMCVFLLASYRNISKQFARYPDLASLNLALWGIMLFYNVTEAGFRSGLMWLIFLLGGIALPERPAESAKSIPLSSRPRSILRVPARRLETAKR